MSVAKIVTPTSVINGDTNHKLSVFLAGTIENGFSKDWQSEAIEYLKDLPINIFNPRREVYPEGTDLKAQINWELEHLENADCIFMNLAEKSLSPISLLELGLFVNSDAGMYFNIDTDFLRYENAMTTITRYRNDAVIKHNLNEALASLREAIEIELAWREVNEVV